MSQFVSTTINKIDAKGRVSVPAGIRQALSAQGSPNFFCFMSYNHAALEAYGQRLMDTMQARLAELDPFTEKHDSLAGSILGDSIEFSCDGEGRTKLPSEFLDHAGITNKVAFVGLGSKFQLWDPSRYTENRASGRETARSLPGILAGGVGSNGGASS